MAKASNGSGGNRDTSSRSCTDAAQRFIESGKVARRPIREDGGARIFDIDSARKRRAVRRVKEKDPNARHEK